MAKMLADDEDGRREYQRLLKELEQIEMEQRHADLRDPRAVKECQRRLAAVKIRIQEHLHRRNED